MFSLIPFGKKSWLLALLLKRKSFSISLEIIKSLFQAVFHFSAVFLTLRCEKGLIFHSPHDSSGNLGHSSDSPYRGSLEFYKDSTRMMLSRYPSFTSKALVHIPFILFLQYCTPEKYLCELDILSAMVLFTLKLKSQNNAVHGRRNVSKSLWRLPTHWRALAKQCIRRNDNTKLCRMKDSRVAQLVGLRS